VRVRGGLDWGRGGWFGGGLGRGRLWCLGQKSPNQAGVQSEWRGWGSQN